MEGGMENCPGKLSGRMSRGICPEGECNCMVLRYRMRLLRAIGRRLMSNGGAENAGVENAGAITYGKPSE